MVERLSTIGAGVRIDGHLAGHGSVELQGHFEGSIHIGGQLIVAAGAMARADVLAGRVLVHGTLIGAVRASHEVRVGPEGELQGPVEGHLIVDDGGVYRGRMTPGPPKPQKTVNARPRLPSRAVDESDLQTIDGMPSIEPAATLPAPAERGESLRGGASPRASAPPESEWFGEAPRARRTIEAPPPLEITEGEPPPVQSMTEVPAITDAAVAMRLGAAALSRPRRTTSPGTAPFRTAFVEPLPAPPVAAAPPGADPRPAPTPRPIAPPDPTDLPLADDPDLSDVWFLNDEAE